jgi:hypothetical protein
MLDRLRSSYVHSVTSAVQQAWICLSTGKLSSAKKVALCGAALFLLYQTYRAVQSLRGRAEKLKPSTDNPLDQEISKTKTTHSETDGTENKTSTSEASSSETDESESEIDETEACSSESDTEENYESSEGEMETVKELPLSKEEETKPVKPTPLSKWKAAFPGNHIKVTYQKESIFLSDFLMKTLFRADELQTCQFNETTGKFNLTYRVPKILNVTQLPEAIKKEMGWKIKSAVNALLKITPAGQISEKIEGQFVQTDKGTKIVLSETAFVLTPNTLKYTAYLKSILIPKEAKEKLVIDADHNSRMLGKSGQITSQLFAEIIERSLKP